MSRRRPNARRARRGGPWRVVALLACAIGVIAGMLAIADRSNRQAERSRQAQVLMERVRRAGASIDAITWRTVATSRSGRVPASVVRDGLSVYAEVTRSLRELRRIGVARSRTGEVERRIGDAYGIGMQALLVSRENPGAAGVIARTRFTPAMARVDAAIARASRRQAAAARAAVVRTRIALFGSTLIGVLLLALLAWRVHRTERGNALAEEARRSERRVEQRLHALVRHSSDVVAVVDATGTVRWLAESVQPMLGHEAPTLIGAPLVDLVHPDSAHRVVRFLESAAAQQGRVGTLSVPVRAADGGYRPLEIIADNRLADPLIEGILLNLRDVSERVALEEQLRHQAFHDPLTGLANRALFEDRLGQGLVRAARHGGRPAVLFVDLDDFKTVNDSLGHAAGDALLRETAIRLRETVRTEDTVARLGGDEFAVLLEHLECDDEALEIAGRMGAALEPALEIAGRELRSSASIGVAWAGGGATAEDLLRNADVAMYVAKDRGKAQVAAFEAAMHAQVVERMELTAELEKAIERGELALQYQPIIDLRSGDVADVEALVRWDHPTRGRLSPDRFIALAESSGAIVALGEWVLRTACAQLRGWRAAFPGRAALGASVNVSTRQLARDDFPARVRTILADAGVAPEQITLEITEHLLADDGEHMLRQLRALHALGVRLAVDDFGTGYSSLSYLQSFPIHILKIDRSFVAGVDVDPERARLVGGIVDMGHSLRMAVVTEGIEEPGEAALLRDLDADYGQGYLFSRPLDADAMTALLGAPAPWTVPAA